MFNEKIGCLDEDVFWDCFSLSLSVGVIFTLLCLVLAVWKENIMNGQPVWISVVTLLSIISAICVVIIWRQPESKEAVSFKVHTRAILTNFLSTGIQLHGTRRSVMRLIPLFFVPSPFSSSWVTEIKRWPVKLMIFSCFFAGAYASYLALGQCFC